MGFAIKVTRVLGILLAVFFIDGVVQRADADPSYVGTEQCVECHQDAAAAWQGSHHALAWTEPTAETVIGDFNDTEFVHSDGMRAAFRIVDGVYRIIVTERDGTVTDYPVHSVAGIAPLQQYLLETEAGRQQSFDVVWDAEKGQWYHLYPDQDLPPDDGLHWTGPYKNWNARCAECHATGYERNYDIRTDSYASTQAEIGVGCEACHGPGSAHLDWAAGLELAQTQPSLNQYGLTMSFGQGDTEAEIQQCATCHSRREALTNGNPVPGTAYYDAHRLALLRPGLYHADGQILEEVYVYGSFLQSKMYAQGVGCMDCHQPHSATRKLEGNALCTQCHSEGGNDRFPTLKQALYDDPSHHFHPVDSDAAQCKSCHMIERNYMGIDGRRDHSFRVPRPDVGAATGSPDACTDCHTDQDQDWAAARIAEWYPDGRQTGSHYGLTLAAGRADPAGAAADLRTMALDPATPAILRATAMYLLESQASAPLASQTADLLRDDDPLIRAAAIGLQVATPPADRAARLMPLLTDPVLSVRIAAARQMLSVPPDQIRPSARAALAEAMLDWQRSLSTRLDYPETHLVLGGMALTSRNFAAAREAFGQVVRFDPQRVDAWSMLIRITEAIDGRQAAVQVLSEALDRVPDDPGLINLKQQLISQ